MATASAPTTPSSRTKLDLIEVQQMPVSLSEIGITRLVADARLENDCHPKILDPNYFSLESYSKGLVDGVLVTIKEEMSFGELKRQLVPLWLLPAGLSFSLTVARIHMQLQVTGGKILLPGALSAQEIDGAIRYPFLGMNGPARRMLGLRPISAPLEAGTRVLTVCGRLNPPI